MREKLGDLKGKNFCFLGDGRNNMANSFLVGCGKMGVNLVIIAPKELWPKEELVALAKTYADAAGKFGEAADGTVNGLALTSGGSIMMGDYLTIRAKQHTADNGKFPSGGYIDVRSRNKTTTITLNNKKQYIRYLESLPMQKLEPRKKLHNQMTRETRKL